MVRIRGEIKSKSKSKRVVTAVGYVPDDTYRLRAGGRLSFQILEDRDPSKSLVVTDSGELDVPYIGWYESRNPRTGNACYQLSEFELSLAETIQRRLTSALPPAS